MGKSLASLFGINNNNSKKISKLKTLLSLSVSRLSILKNHHQARCSLARGDIAQLLQLGHSDRALLRAEIVVKEENMLDVFSMIQSYCHLIAERAVLLLQCQKECPHELKEAVSSLIYASSRSGEMPELQHVCNLFTSMFGREFVRAATELRNSCGVNPKIVQKLSTKQPSLESRVRIINDIAAAKGITLDLNYEEDPFSTSNNIAKVEQNSAKNKIQHFPDVDSTRDSSSASTMHNYKDVASAARAAYEKAEDAAAAARAAVELSRSSHSSDDHGNKRSDGPKEEENKGVQQVDEDSELHNVNKINPVQSYSSESEQEDVVLYSDKNRNIGEQFQSGFSSDSTEGNRKNFQFDNKSESETEKQWGPSYEESEGQSLKMERQFIAASNASERKDSTFFNPRYSVRKFRDNLKSSLYLESDTTGLLNSSHEDSSETETYRMDHMKKVPTQQSKVTRRAVSVRTRPGTHK